MASNEMIQCPCCKGSGFVAKAGSIHVSRATYSVKEAATVLGMTADAVYNAVHRNDVPHVRIGGKILIPRARLDRMLGIAG